MEQCLGKKYVLVRSENFEEYLIFMGTGYIARKAAMTLKPEQGLHLNADGTYTLSFNSLLISSNSTFTLGEEFEEVKPDGVKVKSIVTLEDNKMFHTQTEASGRVSRIVREFFPDKMIVITTVDGFDKILTRLYTLSQ